ncbi:hypothetical protein BH10BDE1_BH10BDE1_13740 [soil metagenome]
MRFIRPLYGLVLTGGRSQRMKTDKALLKYNGPTQAQFVRELLRPYCEEVYLSARMGQWNGTTLENLPTIFDEVAGLGPVAGLMAAFAAHSDSNWLVIACDLPFVNRETIETLIAEFDPIVIATCFENAERGFPEPLCALYSPAARAVFAAAIQNGLLGPVKILSTANIKRLKQIGAVNLTNVNTPEQFAEVTNSKH